MGQDLFALFVETEFWAHL